MIIELINILLDIRNYTLHATSNSYVEFTSPFSLTIWNFNDKSWILSVEHVSVLEKHFPNDKIFVAWLNHKCQNIEFENEMERYLNLKAFI